MDIEKHGKGKILENQTRLLIVDHRHGKSSKIYIVIFLRLFSEMGKLQRLRSKIKN